ncbi:Sulfate permease family protein [Saccharopolyspora flava]|uniref:Sulfate permease family protein n=1 Tax=Saccharopolyspora flava TaxID=95161 RepID=A0A1I6UTR2_9PSEU|nr:Sulfate permease family protein [Saccharopolyspora flava]
MDRACEDRHEVHRTPDVPIEIGAGLLQILLGMSKVARVALAISPAVVQGMLAGIGIVIVLAQIHVVFGGQPHTSAPESLASLPGQLAQVNPTALGLGVLTVGVLLVWPRLPRQVSSVPSQLIAVVLATATAWVAGLDVPRVNLPDDLLNDHVLPAFPEWELGQHRVGRSDHGSDREHRIAGLGDRGGPDARWSARRPQPRDGGTGSPVASAVYRSPVSSCAVPPTWPLAPAVVCRRFCTVFKSSCSCC